MKKNDVMGGKYLNADDVRERDLTLTIEECVMEEFKQEDGYKSEKMVLVFRNHKKKLACGKEKAAVLFEMFGDDTDTDDWGGNRIRLYLGKTSFAGKRVDCVSIGEPKSNSRPEAEAPSRKPASKPDPEPDDEAEGDDVPY